jgi:hypothetical protein
VRRAGAAAVALTALMVPLSILLSLGLEGLFDRLLYGFLALSLAIAGGLIATRHPGNAIGWIFCAFAVYLAAAELADGYGLRAAEEGWPGADVGTWVIEWSWIGELTVWAFVFLLFPDGRLPGKRWRVVAWTALAGCALALPGQALNPDIGASFEDGRNPFAVEVAWVDVLFGLGSALLSAALLASVVAFVIRLRRARGIERQQLKWFAWAAASVGMIMPFAIAFWYESVLVQVLAAVAFNALPVAAGIAILRYRLYDIDVVINRTLVYGALTATLAAAYLASVLVLQLVLSPLTEQSDLAIAGSTLAVAALFRPARARIQQIVDHRFYRRRYDAARTLEAFGARLRDEVALDSLSGELRRVVGETMQPAHLSLWLRAPR